MESSKVVDIVFDLLEKENELLNIKRSIKDFEDFKAAVQIFYSSHSPKCSSEHDIKRLAPHLLKDKNLDCCESELDFKEFAKTISFLFVENKEPNVFLRQYGRFSHFISNLMALSSLIISIIALVQ